MTDEQNNPSEVPAAPATNEEPPMTVITAPVVVEPVETVQAAIVPLAEAPEITNVKASPPVLEEAPTAPAMVKPVTTPTPAPVADNVPAPALSQDADTTASEIIWPADLVTQFSSLTVKQEYEHNLAGAKGKVDPQAYSISFSALPINDVLGVLESVPEAAKNDTEKAVDYLNVQADAARFIPPLNRFDASLNREGSQWRQYLDTELARLAMSVPRIADKDIASVSGERALLRMRALMGKGSIVSIPLYHSGFWVTLKAPDEDVLLELHRRLAEDKIQLGRDTGGLVFSNTQAFTSLWLLNICMEHLFETTLKNPQDVRSKIKTLDLPVLFWGLAASIYNNGFQYSRAIVTPEGVQSKEIVTAKIDLHKLLFVDNAAFTPLQRKHMSNRMSGTVDDTALERYQSEFALGAGRQFKVNDDISVILKVPSAESYVNAGQRWITDVIAMVDRIFTATDTDPQVRQRAIGENAQATRLRQYAHWIDSIKLQDQAEINDRETLEKAIDLYSSDAVVREGLMKAIGQCIDDATLAVIGIPETSGKETGLPRFPRVIPIDVGATFFTLLTQRIVQILSDS